MIHIHFVVGMHACMAVISLFYRMLSMFLSLKIGQVHAFLCMTKDPQPFCSEHGCTAIIFLCSTEFY